MQKLTQEELDKILDRHELWLKTNGEQGKRADLNFKDLRYRDLSGRDLRCADLSYSDLRDTILRATKINNKTDLRHTLINGIKGKNTISVQISSSFRFISHNIINYWVDLDIATIFDFQGTLNEIKEQVKITFADNEILRKRHERAINFINETLEDYKQGEII